MKPRSQTLETTEPPRHLRENPPSAPGSHNVKDQGVPIRPIRVPEEPGAGSPGPVDDPSSAPRVLGDVKDVPDTTDEAPTADHMRVLVAEDDPVNSRIIKKRLEKLGHEVYLTVNGEECSTAYGEKTGYFDIVLMDMQMPIVDGLTSTKLIRSFEKSHPSHILSQRASLNGRVPIIAVSASLIEKERQQYIDAGFDGWILKPIAFDRLSHIMKGIVHPEARTQDLYKPGSWESGGWFGQAQKDVFAADTKPSGDMPMTDPSEGAKVAAASDDPQVKEEGNSRQTEEQQAMASEQDEGWNPETEQRPDLNKAKSMPDIGRSQQGPGGVEASRITDVTDERTVESPAPMTPQHEKKEGEEG